MKIFTENISIFVKIFFLKRGRTNGERGHGQHLTCLKPGFSPLATPVSNQWHEDVN